MLSVAVADAASAKGLVQRLAGAIKATSVSLDADRSEVHVETTPHSNQTVGQILAIIEDWLEEAHDGSALVRLDGNSYLLERRPSQIASSQ